MLKYEFTLDKKEIHGSLVTQIRALVDIPLHNVKKGDLGGWITGVGLPQSDSSWICPDAILIDSRVKGDTLVEEGVIQGSTVEAQKIACSWIKNSTIKGKAVIIDRRSFIENSIIETDGEVKVTGASELHSVKLFASDVYIGSSSMLHNMVIRGTKITVTKKSKISGGKLEGELIYIKDSVISKSTLIEGNDIRIEESEVEDFKMNGDGIFLTGAKLIKGRIRANRLSVEEHSDIYNCHIQGDDISMSGEVKLYNSSVCSSQLRLNGVLDIDWVYFEGDFIEIGGVVYLHGIDQEDTFQIQKDAKLDGVIRMEVESKGITIKEQTLEGDFVYIS